MSLYVEKTDLFVFFISWVAVGILLFILGIIDFQNSFGKSPKNHSGISFGKNLISYWFITLAYAYFGTLILNIGYWGTFADWFSGTGIVALTAYLVYETTNQRKSQYVPCVVFSNQFVLYAKKFDNKWLWADSLSCDRSEFKPYPPLEIYNVGKGVAKDLEITINANIPEIKSKIKNEIKNPQVLEKLDNIMETMVETTYSFKFLINDVEKHSIDIDLGHMESLYELMLECDNEELKIYEKLDFEVILKYCDLDDKCIEENYICNVVPDLDLIFQRNNDLETSVLFTITKKD